MAKLLQIDFDGVLNTYCGNYNENEIPNPREGVKDFLEKLSQTYRIEIFTVRNKKSIFNWLLKYELDQYIYNISNTKNPYASIIIDDRALNFNGDFNKTLEEIFSFSPHWKN